MIEKTVAERYSQALLSAADTPKMQDEFLKQLEGLFLLQKEIPALKTMLLSPVIPTSSKQNVIKKICEREFDPKLVRFLLILLEKKRIRFLPGIIDSFKSRLQAARGVMQVKMITAIPISPMEKKDLKARLEASTGKTIDLLETVDPKIGGGGVLILDGHIYDASVSTKLERLKNHLLSHYS